MKDIKFENLIEKDIKSKKETLNKTESDKKSEAELKNTNRREEKNYKRGGDAI